MADRGGEFSFLEGIHVGTDIWRYIHFYKTYDHQIWQVGTSSGFDLSETNQAGAGDVITLRSCDKLKTSYIPYQSHYDQ